MSANHEPTAKSGPSAELRALIHAAEKYAANYDGDDRHLIKTDVINAFYAGSKYGQDTQPAGASAVYISAWAFDQLLSKGYVSCLLDTHGKSTYADGRPPVALHVTRPADVRDVVTEGDLRMLSAAAVHFKDVDDSPITAEDIQALRNKLAAIIRR